MDEMTIIKNIKYYEDLDNGFLLAHEKHTEFFVMYVPETKQWKDCRISFLNFQHDYIYKEISKEEIIQKTDGVLPESNFKEYLAILRKNLGSSWFNDKYNF